jgi:hypothetical protein
MWIILTIIAVLLFFPLSFINFFAVLYKYGLSWKTINGFFKQTAIDIDRFGNHNFRTLLNLTLRTDEGYEFGNFNETISSALGKNQRDNTLTATGLIVCKILHWIDKNHCKKSIKEL